MLTRLTCDDDGKVVDIELHQLGLSPVVEVLGVENHQGALSLPEEFADEETQTEQQNVCPSEIFPLAEWNKQEIC